MPFIPLVDLPSGHGVLGAILFWSGIALFGLVIALIASSKVKRKSPNSTLPIIGLVNFIALAGAFLVIASFITNAVQDVAAGKNESRSELIRSEIKDSYGLKLSDSQLTALNYPTAEPEGDFVSYGHFDYAEQVKGSQPAERTIYLVWADNELQLSESEDGKSFDELEAAK